MALIEPAINTVVFFFHERLWRSHARPWRWPASDCHAGPPDTQNTGCSCLRFGCKVCSDHGASCPCWSPVDEQDLAWNPAVSPLLAAAATRPSNAPRRKAPPKPSFARMPDWLRWITSCQPSIPRRLPGSPRAAEERARHPARLDQGAQRLLEGGRLAPVRGRELPVADHRVADKRRPTEGADTGRLPVRQERHPLHRAHSGGQAARRHDQPGQG